MNLPPFLGNAAPVLPPVTGAPMMPAPVPTPYQTGPWCFGLDQGICGTIIEDWHGFPLRETCRFTANLACGFGILLALVVVLGIAVQGLLS